MRPNAITLFTTSNSVGTSYTVDSQFLYSASAQALATGTPTATVKFQASNDTPAPVTWTDISGQTVTVSTASSYLIPKFDLCYRWLKIIFTPTGAGIQTVAPIADTGVKQHQTVTTTADIAGSLNSTYFLLSSLNLVSKAQKNFYMWFDDGAGVDPAIAGKTGIHITYSDGDTANTLATSMRTALNALTNDFVATGSNAAVIITNVAAGPVTAAADGTAATHFTFGSATAGVVSNLINTYFLLSDEADAHSYFVWMNPDSIGTAPVIAGRTAVPIVYTSGASAGTIGTAMATAIGALNASASFTTSGTTTVSVTNKVAGPFTPMVDGAVPTGFAFAVTAGSGSTTVSLNTLGF